ncbi:inorganic phosphate transporter [Leptolyngbya sp. FACHB-261]|uniref:inorganic phosphate transporter n=1 Tax=Leptolyngbya sp. FACHB-261 TaxID=2692806 RepID=UPI001684B9B4|nr:inorganic phosphate transporter [Leptolyngbya sp. FACHB-261]MBD2099386.1 inorganic phosphate transporter [Leptolyngbya sp. FACHB-261]
MLLLLLVALAFYLAFNLGANDVANAMGTSVGSGALSLRRALLVAGVLELTGAVLFGKAVSTTIGTGIVNPSLFVDRPQMLLLGMMVVLLACALWLQIATAKGLPVSSSHAVVGALAGFGILAVGKQAVDWPQIGVISLTWLVTPPVSGLVACALYSGLRRWILEPPDAWARLREWVPWLSAGLCAAFGTLVLPTVSKPLQVLLAQRGLDLPNHDLPLLLGTVGAIGLTAASWRALDRQNTNIEQQLARFQVLSACCVAFAHGSNDVGNAIAPLAVAVEILKTDAVPLQSLDIPLWVLALGGVGLVTGLAVLGARVIKTVGEGIISLQPSGGFCAELATAITVLLASRLGLPVSTSHALVGGVVGVGLVRGLGTINLSTVRQIALAWLVTIPIAALLAAGLFWLLNRWF